MVQVDNDIPWEMLHCIFINSLQDGYDMLIFYIAVFGCRKKKF